MTAAVHLDGVTLRYAGASGEALRGVDLTIPEGQVVLVTGPSGCGKSTLLGLVNGLIPHLHPADIDGTVSVTGVCPADHELHEMGRIVSTVFQNPRTQFFCADSTAELAFASENAGLPPTTIRERITTVTQELGMSGLLGCRMAHLSGGQKQQVAIAAAAVNQPRVHVLDEPTSNLDDAGVEAVRHLLDKLRRAGRTVLISEHRLGFLEGLVDRVIVLDQGRVHLDLPADRFYAIGDERRRELGLRCLKGARWVPATDALVPTAGSGIRVEDLTFRYRRGLAPALILPSLHLPRGRVTVITGANGAGKSTLVRVLAGLARPTRGRIVLDGRPLPRRQLLGRSHVVMQDVNRQLFSATVLEELTLGSGTHPDPEAVLEQLGLAGLGDRHPMALSGGQRQRVAVATAMTAGADLVLFDEPTSGLDHRGMTAIATLLRHLAASNRIVAVVTHDQELAAECGDLLVHLGP